MLTLHGATDEVLESLRQGVRDADASGDDDESFRARLALVEALDRDFGKSAEALSVALDLEAWSARLGDPPFMRQGAARLHAAVLSSLGRHEESFEQFRKAIRLAEEIPLPLSFQAAVNFDYGSALSAAGRYAEAERQLARSMELFEQAPWTKAGDRIVAWVNLGIMRAHQGRLSEALQALEKGSALLGRNPDLESTKVWVDSWHGRVLLELGRLDESQKLLQEVAGKPPELDVLSHAGALAGLARIFVQRGPAPEALAAARKAAAEDDGSNAAATAYIRFSLAQALRASGGDEAKARELAKQALQAFQGPENGYRRGQIERWLAGTASP
ncbi:MAG: tetratricopeptide repeat protein [Myxococcales bacterium]